MRLTLRTLLAYLDNTLQPDAEAAIREKLEGSSFATQLVQRIRSSISAATYSAPTPDSVHPIEEPNMMSEYLDSTLSPEQEVEVEKACLESEPHLAEAAGCHQILTMIEGRPADVSTTLRDRIYGMVDPDTGEIALGLRGREASNRDGNRIFPVRHSDIDLGPDAPPAGPAPDDVHAGNAAVGQVSASAPVSISSPASDSVAGANTQPGRPLPGDREAVTQAPDGGHDSGSGPVTPVGADDSGVFEAALKMQDQSFATPDAGATLDEIENQAGERSLKSLERSDFYEGDIRPSRITPWLVSLALVGVLLFAVGQIFSPLFRPQVADSGDETAKVSEEFPEVAPDAETVVPPEDAPPGNDVAPDTNAPADPAENAEVLPTPNGEPIGEATSDVMNEELAPPVPDPNAPPLPESMEPLDSDPNAPPIPEDLLTSGEESSETGNVTVEMTPKSDGAPVAETDPNAPPVPIDERVAMAERSETLPTPESVDEPSETGPKKPAPDVESPAWATLGDGGSLVAVSSGDDKWKIAAAKSPLPFGVSTVCLPEYRAKLALASTTDPAAMTLIGPTRISPVLDGTDAVMGIEFGRGLIGELASGSSVTLAAGNRKWSVSASEDDSSFAYEVAFHREMGADPMVPENHSQSLTLIATSGSVEVEEAGEAVTLQSGQVLMLDLVSDVSLADAISQPDALPDWIDPEIDSGSLEAEAAANLKSLVSADASESLLVSLRVALSFRRNEVAALAGKSMLALDDASAYFGVDGLLSQPKQRLYWDSHLDSIREMLNRSVGHAIKVRSAISGKDNAMDNADAETLLRLLVGYSQEQLQTGGDAALVKALESASMPVRVLASENLRDISGTTLFFKPEETIESRRAEVVKKWYVRLRKGSIRWPESE